MLLRKAVFLCLVTPFVPWMESLTPGDSVAQIANVHTVFNIVTTLILLPFGSRMAAIAIRILPEGKQEEELNIMKEQCLEAMSVVNDRGESASVMLDRAAAMEQKIDDTREKYLKKQMQRLKKGKCKPQTGIIFTEVLTDFERIGDHVKNIAEQYIEMEN